MTSGTRVTLEFDVNWIVRSEIPKVSAFDSLPHLLEKFFAYPLYVKISIDSLAALKEYGLGGLKGNGFFTDFFRKFCFISREGARGDIVSH